jgi:hypothetical protein
MCSGGGGGGVITMPKTGAYDSMLNLQMQAMRDQSSGALQQQQGLLNNALAQQQGILQELAQAKALAANETAANAARLANLIGTPPPEKMAKGITTGANRTGKEKPKGSQALRIDVGTGDTAIAAGSGLNIT